MLVSPSKFRREEAGAPHLHLVPGRSRVHRPAASAEGRSDGPKLGGRQ
jgi:hypothetical protein